METDKQNQTETLLSQENQPTPKDEKDLSWLKCFLCGRTAYQGVETSKGKTWAICYCGSRFHPHKRDWNDPDKKDVLKEQQETKEYADRLEHFCRIYMPLIEEATYGRQVLEIGNNVPKLEDKLRDRGWITQTITTSNFLTHDFGVNKYYLIMLNGVLEQSDMAVAVLSKARDLLFPSGMLLITTADTEIIEMLNHPGEFRSWDTDKYRAFFSKRQLIKTLNYMGFEIMLSRMNIENRLFETNEVHIIAVKTMEEIPVIQTHPKEEVKNNGETNSVTDSK